MQVGVPQEIKNHEYRVGLVPSTVNELTRTGHRVVVQHNAGTGSGFSDAEYSAAGARLTGDIEEVFSQSDMIVKVKEPQPEERRRLREGQILFTYLHLAPDPDQTRDLIRSKAVCIAYETVTSPGGGLPLLAPMSEVAGRLAPQVGAHSLQKANGGRGVLLGGVPGVLPANVLILGGGVSGSHAAMIALGMGANVTILDRSHDVLKRIDTRFGGAVRTAFSNAQTISELIESADLVIGTVLIPGASAPKLITRSILGMMKPGAVIVDVSIDQGGCCETSRPTTHAEPIYVVDGIVHYCVANMPGAVARTSTMALNNATFPYVMALANKGWKQACLDDAYVRRGVNVIGGAVTCEPVAIAQGLEYRSVEECLQ
ncbi:alanine dehydrogenase [Hyphomicrobium sp. CS1BSMeth3]|uniref:alanine dehydrogenase n=1 Tax=Hyphomicrobium sp. CS1BSMeth3 TaxID=1892844 RepID=UPI00092FEF37|nr:alanine dehydrogenase [Hyphomicrobium sp. CS1BSMeth3]